MEQKFFVAQAFRYAESGNWDYKLVGMYDTLSEAKQSYHSRMGSIIKPSNDIAMVIIYDSLGNRIQSDYDSTYVEPEPEPTTTIVSIEKEGDVYTVTYSDGTVQTYTESEPEAE